MALRDPVAVYSARHQMEAHLLREKLGEYGIEAFITEGTSQLESGGMLGEMRLSQRPQLWVDREQQPMAMRMLAAYEEWQAAQAPSPAATLDTHEPIAVVCEDCGHGALFVRALAGTIQNCPHCGKYVDVETPENLDAWQNDLEYADGEQDADARELVDDDEE